MALLLLKCNIIREFEKDLVKGAPYLALPIYCSNLRKFLLECLKEIIKFLTNRNDSVVMPKKNNGRDRVGVLLTDQFI